MNGEGESLGEGVRDASTTEETVAQADSSRLLRRSFLSLIGATGLSAVVPGSTAAMSQAGSGNRGPSVRDRMTNEFQMRTQYSRNQLITDADPSGHPSNDRLSESLVLSKFGKSLPHTEEGLPETDAYETLAAACESGSGYESIPQAYEGVERPMYGEIDEDDHIDIDLSDLSEGELHSRPLVQPETAWTYMTDGASIAQLRMPEPPAFDDPEAGAEMIELYWRALTRDINFYDYPTSDLVQAAAAELDSLDAYQGPGADDEVTVHNVFRGVTPGAERGPYVSQLLWKDRKLGGGVEDQRIRTPVIGEETASINPSGDVGTGGLPRTDYMTTIEDWKKIQKGISPSSDRNLDGNQYTSEHRYIITGRDMAERVHGDPPFRQLQKAAQVLIFTMNAPLDPELPYTLKPFDTPGADDNEDQQEFFAGERTTRNFLSQTTEPFNDFGPLYIEKKVYEASEIGQKAAWHKKWNVHRRLRPEEYAGRIEAYLDSETEYVNGVRDRDGNQLEMAGDEPYPIPDNVIESEALRLASENYQSYLLPQAYAEGSPTHPSYPAGHSVVAGAGVTVLKALFDGDYEFPDDEKVIPTRDGSELLTAERFTDSDRLAEEPSNLMGVTDSLTVRGELNKLASNMALGRNRAGIHYRTDGIEGLRLGERAAIQFMEDQLCLPTGVEELNDRGALTLTLETFDGEERTIRPTV